MGCSNTKGVLAVSTSTPSSPFSLCYSSFPLRVLWYFPNTRKMTLLPNGLRSNIAISLSVFRQKPRFPHSIPFLMSLFSPYSRIIHYCDAKIASKSGFKDQKLDSLNWHPIKKKKNNVTPSIIHALALVSWSKMVLGINPISCLYCASDKYNQSSMVMNRVHFPMRSGLPITTLITVPTLMA